MASPTTPMHGKFGALYRKRPNNFKGAAITKPLNDVTWGAGYNGAASGYFEVVIDYAGTPDTFKWRKNGGSWTAGVAITGAAQTLSDAQTITFGATTGHTIGDQWTIGNLKAEDCTESGQDAQITDATKRLLNPDVPPVFTDSGGAQVVSIDYASGTAHFNKNVTVVTVEGNNGFIVASGLQKLGYCKDWSINAKVDMADISALGDLWKAALPGQAGGDGSAEALYIGNATLFEEILESLDSDAEKSILLQLFNYDPDQDQTGDHFNVWAKITSWGIKSPLNDIVKENINFEFTGMPAFVANV